MGETASKVLLLLLEEEEETHTGFVISGTILLASSDGIRQK